MMKPLSTGSEMNAARKPRRSPPATSATSPVARARAVVSASTCAGSVGSVATAATTLRERAAVADIGDTTRWRELPSSA